VVMQKLADVGTVVVDVGEMCRMHDLKEEELPPNLRAVLGSLKRCVPYISETDRVLILFK
jgi:predicted transcriptional regulator